MTTRWLFVDMNSYFASVEQQLQPHLWGRPIGVIPLQAETTCCIAASYEAKRFGVKTGTTVAEARELCPGIQFVLSRTEQYVHFHKRIVKAVDSVLPVYQVHSIDEMSCQLDEREQDSRSALAVGQQVKRAIRAQVGEMMISSVGLAPNRLLAKVAAEMQKPDGLVLLRQDELRERLATLQLDDFPGIGSRMLRRFRAAGIYTTAQLLDSPRDRLREIWGGVVGERWWHLLRGEDIEEAPTKRRTVGHQHVLPPQLRTLKGAYSVLVRLIHKAGRRLRGINYWAGMMTVQVDFLGSPRWTVTTRLGYIQDTQAMVGALELLWRGFPFTETPFRVSVTLHGLKSSQSCGPLLFPEQQRRTRIARVMDAINEKLGTDALYLGAMHEVLEHAPDRIAFGYIPEVEGKSIKAGKSAGKPLH